MSQPQPQRPALAFARGHRHDARMPPITPQQDTPRETGRRLENLARLGTIAAVRLGSPARCRVQMGETTTGWLPWLAHRAANRQGSHWWPPVIGEQCLVISPGGDLGQGVALLGVYSDAFPAPASEAGVEHTQWSELDWAQYRESRRTVHLEQEIRLEVGETCSIDMLPDRITLQVGGACSIDMLPDRITISAGGATLTLANGRITADVDIISGSISAQHHVHGGVTAGGDNTGAPR